MRPSRFSAEQIVAILKEHEAGAGMAELCRRHGVSQQTFYQWRQQYGGRDRSAATRLRAREDENARLTHRVAEQPLNLQALRDRLRQNS